MEENSQIFALDIGTNSIVGTILEKKTNQSIVKKIVVKNHKDRAMLDGQIHDVTKVAEIILDVKKELEIEFGPLTKVNVAAAGRSLKTEEAKVSSSIKGRKLNREEIIHLELMAVQKAEQQIKEKHGLNSQYFCVGYSVLYYYLDGEKIGNLIDQIGNEATVEIIATFLPRVVIDSLATALKRSNLEIDALTLEPIAAIHVLIPPSMRRLNVALVDIGAGTSDIAITDQGTIVNYGMVPMAGDEVTEAISDHFLLDFPVAERVKRQLSTNQTITIQDILGFEQTIEHEEVLQALTTMVDHLAEKITSEILRLNGLKSPKAVMLIGGGSLTPGLSERIANHLNLPSNRVAIRGIDAIQNLHIEEDDVNHGPELITPIGIAVSANQNPLQYRTIYVNDLPVRIFEVKQLTVGDCLLQAGIKMSQLYGRPGLAKIITINGEVVKLSGTFGSPPNLLKNGKVCSLDDPVENGDLITVEKGEDGKDAILTLNDLLQDYKKIVSINGKQYELIPDVTVNGQKATKDVQIHDRDEIILIEMNTIDKILNQLNIPIQTFTIEINNERKTIPQFTTKVQKNGKEVSLNGQVTNGDWIEISNPNPPTVADLALIQNWQLLTSLPIKFNGKEVILTKRLTSIKRGDIELESDSPIYNGDSLIVEQVPYTPFIFQDVFRFVDFELPVDAKGSYQILINKKEVTFFDQIEPGDHLEVLVATSNS